MWINLTDEELTQIKTDLGPEHPLISKLDAYEPGELDGAYISAARESWASDDLEIDDDPIVSAGGDPGAWVAAWVWVTDAEAGIHDDEEEEDDED